MGRQTNNQLELEIPAELENLPAIADFISNSMHRLGIETGVCEVQIAVDEACTNIIKHAYAGAGGTVNITCELRKSDFVVTLRDWGKPFDPHSVPSPDLNADVDRRKIGGLGMYLMKQFMDDISYSFDMEKGNTLIMRKILKGEKREH